MDIVVTKQKTELEYTKCDFCGENNPELFLEAESDATKERFKIVKCNNCGLIYLNPRPVKEIIGRYYPVDSYYSYQDFTVKKLNYRGRLKQSAVEGYYNSKNIFKKILSDLLVRNFLILPPKEKKGRLLDIGCGSGEFLNQMKNFGWEVYGVEINQESADIGNKRGLNIFCGELGGADFPENFFDVVVLSQILEHVYSPGSYLEEIHRLLKEGGILIVGVPNIGCLEIQIFGRNCHALDVPRHLHFFGIASLKNYLEKYGFEIDKILSKKFNLPLQGIKTDLKNFIENECKGKSSLNKIWMSFSVIFRLLFKKSLRFVFCRDKADELGFYISFYAHKPRLGESK
ncbi:MAG TPA: class I SAM-dependent methyltransferase [Terriglobales bacterium]|nr:class I SAM-dependent methyltransferase [Terriglobales bacterium]